MQITGCPWGLFLSYLICHLWRPSRQLLGPLLFLAYINNVPPNVQSTARLFTDDCLLYRTIRSNDDSRQLQHDLERKPTPNSIHGKVLNTTDHANYLVVTISSNHWWNKHIDNIIKKLIPPCPTSDVTFDLALQAPSLTHTRHTFDPPSNTPHLSGPLTLSVRSTN